MSEVPFAAPLAMAAARSRALIAALEARLTAALADCPAVHCVAAAGSLARLEAGPGSDLDAIIVTDAPVAAPRALAARVYEALADLPLRAPKPWGLYVEPIAVATLCDPRARGALDEAPANFGRRFQFLLDTRPLYGRAAHDELQRRVLQWYLGAREEAGFDLLLHDLQRYRHAYAAWQSCKFDREADDGWYLRQAKLGSSRLLGFTGLLLLIGESSRQPARADWLAAHLRLTPLERVRAVIGAYDAVTLARVEFHYESVMALLFDPELRAALVQASPPDAATLPDAWPAPYAEIAQHTAALERLLTRFVLARAAVWAPSFFARLCC
ncbi:MAG TPA: hypothetical protein PJ986_06010 [Gammaproteobacteria bacterium]|nr:hypothetical protein [Gammaproteobacteria bacterium]